jgi:hypothetical protein
MVNERSLCILFKLAQLPLSEDEQYTYMPLKRKGSLVQGSKEKFRTGCIAGSFMIGFNF